MYIIAFEMFFCALCDHLWRSEEFAVLWDVFRQRAPAMQNTGLTQRIAAAIGHHRAGRLADAEAIYEEILQTSPDHIDSLHLSGVIAHQRGNYGVAIERIGRAIALTSNRPVAELHNNIGVAYRGAGQPEQAIAHFARALALKPDYAEAHANLGAGLKDLGQLEEAVRNCRRAVELSPKSPTSHYALGAIFQQQGALDAARACYQQALELKPDYAEAHTNLGAVLAALGDPGQALAHYRKVVAIKPNYPNAHYNLGQSLQQLARADEALSCYRQAQSLKPDYAEAHWNEALALLTLGDYPAGWQKYEWRWRREDYRAPQLVEPSWDGSELAGRSILLHAEQGFGDTIQFARYAPLVKAKGASAVIVECQPTLVGLLRKLKGVDRAITREERTGVDFDCHAPMLSLPGLFGTTVDSIPETTPYLTADPLRSEVWRQRLGSRPGLRVGLVWRGNRQNSQDEKRSTPPQLWASLCSLAGVRCVSLQVDATPGELDSLRAGRGDIVDFGAAMTDWAETAALVSVLDLVISVDTAVAHLAGALKKPVWVLLAYIAHWCWLTERSDSPWYRSARLYRQSESRAWDEVLDRVRDELITRACNPHQ
jgi:tetratricopeptide (TPR) repeat protein